MKKFLAATFATGAMLLAAPSVIAQYQVTTLGQTVTENFDSFVGTGTLPDSITGLSNWSVVGNGTPNTLRGEGNGNSTTAGIWSYGSESSGDRSLGFLASGTGANLNINATTSFVNNTAGRTITSFIISYQGEQWRVGGTQPSNITVFYRIDGGAFSQLNSLTFNAPVLNATAAPLNGNDPANSATLSQTVTGLTVATGSIIELQWRYVGGTSGSGGRQGLSIDDLLVTFNGGAPTVSFSNSGGSAWLTTGNWTGGSVPGSTDVAQFGANPTGTTVGINMGSVAGAQSVGAIDVTSDRTTALAITNSSGGTAGVLTLQGVDVGVKENVILRNSSSQTLTLANGSASTMGVALGNATDNVVVIDGSGNINISSIISGAGRNLTLTGSGTGVLTLSGANTYSGVTSIESGTLALGAGGSIAESARILVRSGATFDVSALDSLNVGAAQALGGAGTITGNLSLAAGAGLIVFDLNTPLTVTGTVSLDNTFSIASLRGADGNPFDWSNVADGTYTLINSLSTFSNIQDFGAGNQVSIGDGRFAYFSEGSLQVNVVPEPSTYALLVLAGAGLGAHIIRRRRRR